MSKKIKYLLPLAAALLFACVANGPRNALDEMAQAMDSNNVSQFMSHMDMRAYTANYLANMTSNDAALSSLDALGSLFGLDGLDKLLGNMLDFNSRLSQKFERGVASGELMAECRASDKPDCPWIPQSLRDAHVIEIAPDAAIARITTPQRLTSWLALRKNGEQWQVVGQAVLESTARAYAQTRSADPAPAPGEKSPSPAPASPRSGQPQGAAHI